MPAMADPDTWQDALTRRLRTLIRTAPLHRAEASKAHRAAALDDQDLRALALRAIDLTIEAMGLGAGISVEELREGLRPLVTTSHPTLGAAETDEIADLVIGALLNESGRRQAFDEPYLALDGEQATRKVLSFHLLRERATVEGETLIYATTEAINLYAGMLEYPVEDAQIAEEAVLQAQVRRGRIAEAVRTAQRARLRSIEYEQKIVVTLESTRRDIFQVDWVNDVLALLDNARQHLAERIEVEREIGRAVEVRFDTEAEAEGAVQLVALRDTLFDCINRHLRLHERLIGANATYLKEQERQAFAPPIAEPLPALEAEVLRVALTVPCAELAEHADELLSLIHAPRSPVALRLSQLVDRLLAPRHRIAEEAFSIGEADLEELRLDRPRFSIEDHRAVEALLQDLFAAEEPPATLSALLVEAKECGLSSAQERLLVLRVLGAYDSVGEGRVLVVERKKGRLDAPAFFGDELHLSAAMTPSVEGQLR